ncbi:MAG: EAL domain-containing protein [Deltaproteobacteria bacterium]|nr:EAL domain-containing protein [Deltaproteobacteria bacterium]
MIPQEVRQHLLAGRVDDIDKKIGFKISIDDFVTGYSSLNYFRRLPVDELKIDRSFVKEVSQHRQSRAIVSSIV